MRNPKEQELLVTALASVPDGAPAINCTPQRYGKIRE